MTHEDSAWTYTVFAVHARLTRDPDEYRHAVRDAVSIIEGRHPGRFGSGERDPRDAEIASLRDELALLRAAVGRLEAARASHQWPGRTP